MTESTYASGAEKARKSSKPVVVLVLSTAIMIASGFANTKFAPLLTDFLAYYNIEMGAMSVIMSVFQWIGIIAMLPVGLMLSRYSPKITGFIGAFGIIIGNVLAIFADTIALLVISRILEGLGYCVLQVLTQSIVTTSYKDSKLKGFATGILNTGMLFGQIIHLNLAPRVIRTFGLNGVYGYIIAVVSILAILWLFLIYGDLTAPAQVESKAEKRRKTLAVYRTRDLWLVALAFSIIRLAVVNTFTYVPAYLSTVRGLDMVVASALLSITTGLKIASFMGYGLIMDGLKTKRKVMIFSCFSVLLVYLSLMNLPLHLIIIFIILYGTLPTAFTTATFSCYPEIFEDRALIPVAHSMVHFVANIFTAVGTIIYGYMIQYLGYDSVWFAAIGLGVTAGILWIFVRKVK